MGKMVPNGTTGTIAPAGTLGNNGEFYFNTVTYDIFNKVSGSWTLIGNIKGANGQDFNATGNIHLYNGTNSYEARTALVAQGIGFISLNFSETTTSTA